MADLTSIQKAPILDQDGNQLDSGAGDQVFSNNEAVCSVLVEGTLVFASGVSAGTATLFAHRNGQTATLDVSVEASAEAFAIHLGTPVDR
jgi:hypothetical protein